MHFFEIPPFRACHLAGFILCMEGKSTHTAHYDERSLHICNVAIKNQQLISACLDAGWVGEAKKLRQLDTSLAALFAMSARKAGFNPSQPRIPAGNPDGGQWTDDPLYNRVDTQPQASEQEPVFIDEMPQIAEVPLEDIGPIIGNREVTYIKTIQHPTKGKVRKVNIFISGGGEQLFDSNIVRHSDSLNRNTYGDNYYTEHSEEVAVIELIERVPKGVEINLIGHSWGADSAAKIAVQKPGRVNKLITIDPVSDRNRRPTHTTISKSAKQWINVNATEGAFTIGNIWAGLGDAWNDQPEDFANVHIRAPFKHADFTGMMLYRGEKGSPQDLLNN